MSQLNTIPCPLCGESKLFELSAITPALVRCEACGATQFLYYVQGYFDGYKKAAEENKRITKTTPGLASAGG